MLICLALISTFSHAAPESSISGGVPEDLPTETSVVHHLRYPLAGKSQVSLGGAYLYGDKFVDNLGAALSYTYFWSEEVSAKLGGAYFKPSISDEAIDLKSQGSAPLVYDPRWIVMASAQWLPVYGKLALGSSILRFKMGLLGGLHMAQEARLGIPSKVTGGDASYEGFYNQLGGQLGLTTILLLHRNLSLDFQGLFMGHSRPSPDESSVFKRMWLLTMGMGVRW